MELMKKVGIPNAENRFDDYPFQYSGGMRQRIVIAIALSCQPKILICDEPTTALDVTIQAQILKLIKDLQKEFGYTIVFITHDLGVVANIADRVAVLVFGALPAKQPGKMPQYAGVTALPLYSCIVPVPPRQPLPGMPGLPLLLARRLGAVLGVPVETPLYIKRRGRPQKELTREQRLQNARGAFGCRPGTDLTGRRVLLIDDIITTGATASACALALLEAGAVEVTAVAIAAAEELPKSRKKPPETKP